VELLRQGWSVLAGEAMRWDLGWGATENECCGPSSGLEAAVFSSADHRGFRVFFGSDFVSREAFGCGYVSQCMWEVLRFSKKGSDRPCMATNRRQ